jgi:hypothetical protein
MKKLLKERQAIVEKLSRQWSYRLDAKGDGKDISAYDAQIVSLRRLLETFDGRYPQVAAHLRSL